MSVQITIPFLHQIWLKTDVCYFCVTLQVHIWGSFVEDYEKVAGHEENSGSQIAHQTFKVLGKNHSLFLDDDEDGKKLSEKRAHDDKLNPFMIINSPTTLTYYNSHFSNWKKRERNNSRGKTNMDRFGKICRALGADRQPIAGVWVVPNSCYSGQSSSPKSAHCPTHPWSERTLFWKR